MLDLKIAGGTVVDGSGQNLPFIADIGVKDGRIVEIGRITARAHQTLDADGATVTPGFVDIHTHYDGQVTWDECFTPSIFHGVTTCVMGNCGVGFAPLHQGQENRLIALMEGVEDIPGVALAEGVNFQWESFPEYMAVLDAMDHSLNFAVQVPHDPLRMYVMGARAEALEPATPADIESMRELVAGALDAGAVGFSTGRTDIHRTADGQWTPSSEATAAELAGIAAAFKGRVNGVLQVVSDFDLFRSEERFDPEFDLVESMAKAADRPLSMTWLQRDPGVDQWRAIRDRVDRADAEGLKLHLQTAARGIGVINGLDTSFHPFVGRPSYKAICHLPLEGRAAAMRDQQIRARILSEPSERLAGDGSPIPPFVDELLAQVEILAGRMFPLEDGFDYEPGVEKSFAAAARQKGCTALEVIYDYLVEGDGRNLIYFPVFNYAPGSLDVVHEMLQHPNCLASLSDAGAHVGTICDASFPTTMMVHWARDRSRGQQLDLTSVVEMLTSRNARYMGFSDRGELALGMAADINVIDFPSLKLRRPEVVRDLPANGRRLLQRAQGYVATLVAGTVVQEEGQVSAARPGKLLRH